MDETRATREFLDTVKEASGFTSEHELAEHVETCDTCQTSLFLIRKNADPS